MQVAANPNCPADVQVKLGTSTNNFVRMALAGNPNLSTSLQATLAADSDPMVVESLVHGQRLPDATVLMKLVGGAQPRVREALAANANDTAGDTGKIIPGTDFHRVSPSFTGKKSQHTGYGAYPS